MNRAGLNIILNNYPRKSVFLGSALIVMLFFSSLLLQAQVISNNGAAISITAGTVVVSKDFTNTSATAMLRNTGTLNLLGNFNNKASSTTLGGGVYRIGGNWSNAGNFYYDTSTVIFNGSVGQQIIKPLPTPETFYNLSIENTGASSGYYIKLEDSVNVKGTLTMRAGDVMTSPYILQLENITSASLNHTSGMVFGLFERKIGETGRFLFPLGNISRPSYYNPATLVINDIPVTGSVLNEFITSPPGNDGLPLDDISVNPGAEIDRAFTAGYWSMTAKNGFSISGYNIELDASGFENATDTVRENTRVIKRISGGDWTLDGIHVDGTENIVKRNNLTDIPPPETHFALGLVNPLIISHPEDTTVCENANLSFSVEVSGNETDYTYAWYKDGVPIPGGNPHYTGRLTATLTINGAELADAGTYYCIVRDRFLRTTTSNLATLTVNKIPVATVTTSRQNSDECSEVPFADIVLGLKDAVPGTTFVWSRTTHDGIETSILESGTVLSIGDALSGSFNNLTNAPITITFTIVPVGPAPTECAGQPIYSTVTVNPKPRVIPVMSEICYGDKVEIILESDTELTMPKADVLEFGYTTYLTSTLVSGFMGTGSNVPYGRSLTNNSSYFNGTDTLQSIIYRVAPTFSSALGCPSGDSVSFEIKIHAQPLKDLIITQPLTCDGGSNAEMVAITSRGAGGTYGYYFEWFRNNNDHEELFNLDTLKNMRSGDWIVTVTDDLKCSNTLSKFIAPGAKVIIHSFVPVDPLSRNAISCAGSADGEILLMEIGAGTAPFEYWVVKGEQDTAFASFHGHLFNANVFDTLTGLTSGRYYLYMKDDNGCYNTDIPTVELTEPPEITVTFESKKYAGGFDVSCKGYEDGMVWIKEISGGNKGYTHKWTTTDGVITGLDTSDTLKNIPAGKYYLHIIDIKGCTAIDSVIITEPLGMSLAGYELSVKTDGVNNVSCYGGSDGYINMEIIGGSGVYTYKWTGPDGFVASTQNISGLKAGDYRCTVTDLNDCQLMTPSFTLTEPTEIVISKTLSISIDGGYNIDCNGGRGFVKDVTVTGGAGGYQYFWSSANGSGIVNGQKDQASLAAGNYVLTVKDINGCEKSDTITLTQPDALSLQVISKPITCLSSIFDDGAINLIVSGGVAPYSYIWSNGSTTKDISGLTEGTYSVTVTDRNGCRTTGTAEIVDPPPLTYTSQISDYNGFNVSCFGLSNGYIHIDITGGTAPYMFNWTGPDGFVASTQNISGLKAGTYIMQITDNLACTAFQTFNLSEPDKLEMVINVSSSLDGGYNMNCAGDKTGYIDIEAINNVGKVEYLWSDGLFGKTRNNLSAGNYSIIITDSNGCYSNTSISLTEPNPIKINFIVEKPFCPDMSDGSIKAEVNGGVITGVYNYRWMDNSINSSLANINPGWYSLTVEDINSCIAKDSVKVEPQNRSCLLIPNAISPNGDWINDVWNIGNIYLYPEAEVKIFNRWGNVVWISEKGYPRPWDGTSKGRDLPVDSYHYIINLNNGGRPILGTITIVK